MCILENIHTHEDLLNLNANDRQILCEEIRGFLVESVSKTGGHVASNLGVVELTVAIETVYNTEKDRLVFDVGHQSYIHKMLTGRKEGFTTLRQFGGLAGFPKPSESITDAFTAGHASSSVSIALGMARARTLSGENYDIVTLLGDGAATGGLAYEGLNDAADSGEPMVVILNDNTLSIDSNVGGMASHLRKIRVKDRYLGMKKKYRSFLLKVPGGRAIYLWTHSIKDRIRRMLIPSTIFENMGFTYIGPVDGHDTENLIHLLRIAKEMSRPVVLHVITQKGRGYRYSEEHPKLFHGVGRFDPESGTVESAESTTFSAAFGKTMVELAETNNRICAITAAMPGGTGLLEYKKKFPKRLFDVGIAEGHAVSMAGGLAKQGMIPVFAVYSTFLQRAYDMILQDICLQGLHVVFAVDRAGLVGEDGETHHGVFDVGFLRHCPGMTVLCPASTQESHDMLKWAIEDHTGPVAVRYPRGGDGAYRNSAWSDSIADAVCVHRKGNGVTIITYGITVNRALEAADILKSQGIDATVLRLKVVAPLSAEPILSHIADSSHVVILEECMENCGIRHELSNMIMQYKKNIHLDCIGLGNGFVPHGKVSQLYREVGMDGESIAKRILEVHHNEE